MLDFDTLINKKEVQAIREHIASDDFLFGRWRQFKTTKKAQFPWGNVDIALHIDEAKAVITDIQIASDCLDTEMIERAEKLLQGCSTKMMPSFDEDNEILRDIIGLIYG